MYNVVDFGNPSACVCVIIFLVYPLCLVYIPAGVEAAFYHSSRVMTLSFHKYSPGFFPGWYIGRNIVHYNNIPLLHQCNIYHGDL